MTIKTRLTLWSFFMCYVIKITFSIQLICYVLCIVLNMVILFIVILFYIKDCKKWVQLN